MPDWLSPEAQTHWPLIAKQLRDAGILTEIDATALGQFCEVFARWKHASDLMGTRLLVKAPSGFLMQSPLLAVVNRAHEQMMRLLDEFGMTPSSRSRVTATKSGEGDPFAKFVKKN
jgi:P27 family predicted phage terminase small subunit